MSDVIKAFRTIVATLPTIIFFRSVVLSVTKGINARSLTMAVEGVSRNVDRGSGVGDIFGRVGVNFVGKVVVKAFSFIFVVLFLVVGRRRMISNIKCGLGSMIGMSLVVNADLLLSVAMDDLVNTVFPVVLSGIRVSPTITSKPFVAAFGSVVTIISCCKLICLTFVLLL